MGNAQSLASETGRVDINTVLQDVSGLDNNGKVSVGGSDFSRLRAIACRNVTAGKGMVGDDWEEWERILNGNPELMTHGDENDNTLLHFAVLNRHHEAAARLLHRGASWEVQNRDGHTPKSLSLTVPKNTATLALILRLEKAPHRKRVCADARSLPHAVPPSSNSWTFTEGQQAALRGLRHDGKAALPDEDASRHVATLLDKMEKQLASAAFQRAALGALASAVSTSESTRRALAGLDAVPLLLRVMAAHNTGALQKQSFSEDIQSAACEVLTFLAFDTASSECIALGGGAQAAVSAITTHQDAPAVTCRALRLLYWLAKRPWSSCLMVEVGVSDMAAALLARHTSDAEVVAGCCDVLQMLARGGLGDDALASARVVWRLEEEGVPDLVLTAMGEHLHDVHVQRAGSEVVRHMAASNVKTRLALGQHGACVPALKRAIAAHPRRAPVAEAVCGALRCLLGDPAHAAPGQITTHAGQIGTTPGQIRTHSGACEHNRRLVAGGGAGTRRDAGRAGEGGGEGDEDCGRDVSGITLLVGALSDHAQSSHVVVEALSALALLIQDSHRDKHCLAAAGGLPLVPPWHVWPYVYWHMAIYVQVDNPVSRLINRGGVPGPPPKGPQNCYLLVVGNDEFHSSPQKLLQK